MKYTKQDIKVLKMYSASSPHNWDYGWAIDGNYSPYPVHSEQECIQQAEKWIAEHNAS